MSTSDRLRLGLWIEPLDLLFFRGGRPFGPAIRAEGGLPHPQTLAGALRTAMLNAAGFDLAAFTTRWRMSDATEQARGAGALLESLGAPPGLTETWFRGPWPMKRPESTELEPLLPVPANLFREPDGKKWLRADPLAEDLPGWDPHHPGRRPLWHRGSADAKRPGGFLTPQGSAAFLAGGVPAEEDWIRPAELYDFDNRTGLEIDAETLTGVAGRLFSIRLLALKPGVGFYAEALVPRDAAETLRELIGGVFPWGGEGRHAVVRVLHRPADWPRAAAPAPAGRALWLLATPGLFNGNTRGGAGPDGIAAEAVVGIASGPAVAVSGWDIARGRPRPTRFAAPAGSVYFVNDPNPQPQSAETSLCGDPEDMAQGWGFALRGAWNDAQ